MRFSSTLLRLFTHPLHARNRARTARAIALGDKARDDGRWQAAEAAYKEALRLTPNLTSIWVQFGHVLKESGERSGAEAAYLRAMACGLDDADIHLQLGHVLKLQGREVRAEEAYANAVRRDPNQIDALAELARLGWSRTDLRTLAAPPEPSSRRDPLPKNRPTIALEVSDLVHYMTTSRRPTGIQRVQLAVVGALLDRPPAGLNVMHVCYAPSASYWVELSELLLRQIFDAMRSDGTVRSADWQALCRKVACILSLAEDADLPENTCLINLGSSWAYSNYFLAARRSKADRNVRHVAFIHDCIPLIEPEMFVHELQRDFREWIWQVLMHADGLLSNSRATASDVAKLAAELGYAEVPITPVPLDAVFSTGPECNCDAQTTPEFLRRHGLQEGRFVLMVSTLEPRKNHALAFDAWEAMAADRGASAVPHLVCVGGRGWRNGAILRRLQESPTLQSRVRLLHNVSDQELDILYRTCRFTMYPSRYEGWGLPITESLSKGKPVLAARTSSSPEAGGDLADYFSLSDAEEFHARLVRLIDDDAYLATRQRQINRQFRPRSWEAIGHEIIAQARAARRVVKHSPPTLRPATFVRLAKAQSAVAPAAAPGEQFREGSGWAERDDVACWLAGHGEAALTFMLPPDMKSPESLHVYLLIVSREVLVDCDDVDDDGRRHRLVLKAQGSLIGSHELVANREQWVTAQLPAALMLSQEMRLVLSIRSATGRSRQGSPAGVRGIFLHKSGDSDARMRFLEGAVLGVFDRLAPDDMDSSQRGDR